MCLCVPPNGSCCIFSAKSTVNQKRSLGTMNIKSFYTRFLFFFIIYLGVNLLIIKIKSSDYNYDNVLSVFKNPRSGLGKGAFNSSNVSVNKGIVAAIALKKAVTFFIDLTDNEKTLKQISETCKENNLTTSTMFRRNFLYSTEHQGLYCYIRKVGSTSFTKMFSDINNIMVTHDYYRQIDFLAPKTDTLLRKLTKDPHIFKLLVVRHPFERLVSAYRDRIEDNTRHTAQSWIFVPKIFHLTRPELFDSSGTHDTSLMKIFFEDKRLKLIPSFNEFVKWLLQQDSAYDDPHWNQYYKHCSLCSVQYDYVLKLDNYTKGEIDYIFSRMNVNKNKVYLSNLEQTKDGRTNFDETCNYFKNLTHEAVVNLYEKYRIDFDMFNYEFDKYFECTDGD